MRIAYLDGIRALAILAVIGSHWGGSYLNLFAGGYIGVDLFFVLSGYIITKIVWRKRESLTYGSFLLGRIRRLYPALIAVVVITTGAIALTQSLSTEQSLLGAFFALVQANSIVEGLDLASSDPFGVTWSLSAEWIFYLLWPCALVFSRALSARRLATIAIGLALLLFFVATPTHAEWFYYGPFSRGAQLLAGAALALLTLGWTDDRRSTLKLEAAALFSLVFVIAWTLLGPSHLSPLYRWVGFPLATVAAVLLILVGIGGRSGVVTRLLSLSWISAIGRASYSLYLWHVIPVMVLDKDLLPLPTPALATTGVLATVVLTYLSYRYLERPFLSARAAEIRSSRAPRVSREPSDLASDNMN